MLFNQNSGKNSTVITHVYRIGIQVQIPIRKAADFANDAHSNARIRIEKLFWFKFLGSDKIKKTYEKVQ